MNPNTRRKRRNRRNERQRLLRILGTLEPDLGDAPSTSDEIFTRGLTVFVTHTIRPAHMEAWVQRIAKLSGQPVDWRQVGGRFQVKTLGDRAKVRRAMLTLRNEHDGVFYSAIGPGRGKMGRALIRRVIDGIWASYFGDRALYPGALLRPEDMTRFVLVLWALITAALVITGSGWEVLWLALAVAPVAAAKVYAFFVLR